MTVLDAAGIQAHNAALKIGVEILFAMANKDMVASHHRRAVDHRRAELIVPGFFAGVDPDGIDAAVGSSRDQKLLAVDDRDHRHAIVGILRLPSGIGPPDYPAVVFVERGPAIAAFSLIAPTGIEHADDDQVIDHRWTADAATIARNAAKLLSQRPLPNNLAILIEAEQ